MITNRHLDLRQTFFVEYCVLRNHLVLEEQEGRQRIYLIGGESPLSSQRHAAIDCNPTPSLQTGRAVAVCAPVSRWEHRGLFSISTWAPAHPLRPLRHG